MRKEYKYKLTKRTKRITVVISALAVMIIVFFSIYSDSGYFPAWFLSFAVAVLALYVLSIPRKVRIDDDTLEIHCLVELTTIAVGDIAVIRKMDPKEMKYAIPLLGSYGFFGYYGYYYNLAEMTMFKIYASQWGNFVRIEDIYEDIYVINCDNPDELIYLVNKAKEELAARQE